MLKKTMAVSAATVAMVMGTSSMAMADNTAISIEKNATRSASHMVLRIQATIVCSPDTTDSALSAQVSQTNAAGGTQTANATWVNLGGAECSGEEERVTLSVRRPTGGFNWRAGEAAVRNVVFTTRDPSGTYTAFLKARTVLVR
jgi:hypothetical protein